MLHSMQGKLEKYARKIRKRSLEEKFSYSRTISWNGIKILNEKKKKEVFVPDSESFSLRSLYIYGSYKHFRCYSSMSLEDLIRKIN